LDTSLDHLKALAMRQRRIEINDIQRRAQHWRLTDCSLETLDQMRHSLIEETQALHKQLREGDERFRLYLEHSRPRQADETLRAIDRLSVEWEGLNKHLQEIDEAILERHLQERMAAVLGSEMRVKLLEINVLVAILVVVALTLAELLLPLPMAVVEAIIRIDTIICIFLLSDFFFRLYLAEDRRWYIRRYWIDFVASIPYYEFLRAGRLIRIARFARLFRLPRLSRAMRAVFFNFRGLNKLSRTFQVNLLKRSVLIAAALLLIGAFTIQQVEDPNNLDAPHSMAEGLWWSFTTVVTGGFADLYNPDSLNGRLLTVGLVLLGLTVTGIFTASLTSVLVEDESTRLEQSQITLESRLSVINHKLDLLSSETNEGLIALETIGQTLSNRRSRTGIAQSLAEAMLRDFQCIQASVHLLDESQTRLLRLSHAGLNHVGPEERQKVGEGLAGKVAARLLLEKNLAALDLEPETEPCLPVNGISMVCPMVAAGRLLGLLHVVLPDELGRYYLYNRAPMALAHHAAIALYAAELAQKNGRNSR
jgi:voltage-gated potassium channel